MKLYTMQFFLPSCYLLSLESEYCPQALVLKHSEFVCFPSSKKPSFTPI
jgi:hypothetical protein